MPSSIVLSFAKKTGKSVAEIEKKWEEAKEAVKKSTSESQPKFYPEVVTVLKKMLHINESGMTLPPTGGGGINGSIYTSNNSNVAVATDSNSLDDTLNDIAVFKKRFGEIVRRKSPLNKKKKKKKVNEDSQMDWQHPEEVKSYKNIGVPVGDIFKGTKKEKKKKKIEERIENFLNREN